MKSSGRPLSSNKQLQNRLSWIFYENSNLKVDLHAVRLFLELKIMHVTRSLSWSINWLFLNRMDSQNSWIFIVVHLGCSHHSFDFITCGICISVYDFWKLGTFYRSHPKHIWFVLRTIFHSHAYFAVKNERLDFFSFFVELKWKTFRDLCMQVVKRLKRKHSFFVSANGCFRKRKRQEKLCVFLC